jgi:hypothetical protein
VPAVAVVGPEAFPALQVPGSFPALPEAAAAMEELPVSAPALEDWTASWGAYNGTSLRAGARTVLADDAPQARATAIVEEGLEALAWLRPESVVTGLPQELAVPVFQARRLLLEAESALRSGGAQTALLSYLAAADRVLELTPRGRAFTLVALIQTEITGREILGRGQDDPDVALGREVVDYARTRIEAGDALSALEPLLEAAGRLDPRR